MSELRNKLKKYDEYISIVADAKEKLKKSEKEMIDLVED